MPGTGEWPRCRISGPLYAHAAANYVRTVESRRNGRSLRELGRLTGVDVSLISRIMRGESWPNGIALFKLSTALGVEVFSERDLQAYRLQQLIEDFAEYVGRPELIDGALNLVGAADQGPTPYVPDLYVPESGMPIETRDWAALPNQDWEREATSTARHFELLNQAFGPACQRLVLLLDPAPTIAQTKWLSERDIQVICRSDSGFTDSLGGWLIERIMRSEPIPRTN